MKKQDHVLLVCLLLMAIMASFSAGKYGRIAKSKEEILKAEKDFEVE